MSRKAKPVVAKVDAMLLDRLDALDRASSAGAWFVVELNDEDCMSAVGVATGPLDFERTLLRKEWPGEAIVAASLVQSPPYVVRPERCWDENTELIALAPTHLSELVRLARIEVAAGK